MRSWLLRPGLPRNGRMGLALIALAGLVALVAPWMGDLVRGGAAANPELSTVVALDGGTATAVVLEGLIAIGAGIGAAAIPRLWAQLAGLVVGGAAAATFAFTVIQARGSSSLSPDVEITLLAGAQTLLVAALLAAAGVVVALLSMHRVPAWTTDQVDDAEPRNPTAGIVALALSILGVLMPLLPALGIAVGAVTVTDARASEGRLRSGAALAAIVVGALLLAVWSTLVAQGILTAEPQD